jgi:hypothetical protein
MVSTIYVALVLTAMQVVLGTDRLNNSGRFTDAAVRFIIFSIVVPLTGVVLVAAIMLSKFAGNGLYTIHKPRTHRAPNKRSRATVIKRRVSRGKSWRLSAMNYLDRSDCYASYHSYVRKAIQSHEEDPTVSVVICALRLTRKRKGSFEFRI